MSLGLAERLEFAVDSAAAAALALSAGFAVAAFGPSLLASFAGAATGLAAYSALRAIAPEPRIYSLPEFREADYVAPVLDELILTEDDLLPGSTIEQRTDVLLLDDILARLEPDSRVVRLFDAAKMPSPAQLRERIDRHLKSSSSPPDASQALYDALAELRRSLA